jgi:D-sedoheptulose 7-phosphate isomerase
MNLEGLQREIVEIKNHVTKLKDLVDSHKEIIVIGNGGSNSIASHITQDYTKALGKKAITFTDPSRLTCYINDYGMEKAYQVFVEEFSTKDTLVVAISSSGESENILNVAKFCNDHDMKLITLSGFNKNNRLNAYQSEINYWVDSKDYGVIECAHLVFLHSIIDYD